MLESVDSVLLVAVELDVVDDWSEVDEVEESSSEDDGG